jgi:hypothetical protein
MTKDLYVLGNLTIDDTNSFPWMCSVPLIKLDHKDHISLQLLQDIHLNFILSKNTLIKMTLYKINVSQISEFSNRRHQIFENKNYSDEYIALLGFNRIKDFTYVINPKEKTQYFDDISLTLSYTENQKIPKGKYYIDCPYITISKNST